MIPSASDSHVRVAILEDHRLVRESLTSILEQAGMPVPLQTGDAERFLAAVADARPSVALIDLTLDSSSGLTGHDVLDLLRESYPDLHTVVLSATTNSESVERCFRQGVSAYLTKTHSGTDSLLETLQRVARGERIFPAEMLELGMKGQEEPRERSALDALTPREREVLAHIANGADNSTIATALHITERTVKAHVSSLYAKLRQGNRAQLALLARRLGIRPAMAS